MKSFNLFFQDYCSNICSQLYFIPIMILSLSFVVASCHTTKNNIPQKQRVEMINDDDSTEYSLIVLDPGYDIYIAGKPSANFYSQQYYENWNRQYITEWNSRHQNPIQYGGFYETAINYNYSEDYGLELNYRLYYYFLFIKDRYGIVLINRGR